MNNTHLVLRFSTLLLLTTVASAQDPTGVLEGQVSDKSGGAIAGAAVSLKNLQTGLAHNRTTAENGFYRLGFLPPGAYVLTVEAPKFSRFSQEPIQIAVSQTFRVDIVLELGSVAKG